ncbi:RNA polymerase sigma factor [Siphonobacter sp. SORGH_AS_0500]|uniref:RNA polymerase sigma factor n=1 Tax=Siphonobacter sp. SORGH_AS_0500 TaxID=1864824 RepID=UPI000CC40CA5|nr:sigma-70 family RNA polymerase sigma factor [Siphonobacter sp. SORGH_AS_0500]MDR6194989.1 RNA polymerase sigma factor (sigma-70 family) [Siphonobacter sp. SORGH_AS_0500]PKK38467.1 hypothetical protein BWI96_01465 [Siphonobacter sp. SORGH_AS_0500]
MPSSEKSSLHLDQELWSRFRGGDAGAFSDLMRRYSRLLFRYGSRLSPNSDLVKDCIQDIYFDLWEHRATIRQTVSVKPYLFKALRLRIFREQGKWNRYENLEDEMPFSVEFSVENQLIEMQETEDMKEKLQKLLNTLPKRQKEILYLKFYEELNHDDIAKVMNMNRQSVYNLMHEAILRLRKNWYSSCTYPALILALGGIITFILH